MKTCKKCNKHLPLTIKIDGKRKNICNRKYCLECSPYGKHNTQQLHKPKIETKTESIPEYLTCADCSRQYEYDYKNTKGHTKIKCNSCKVNDRRFWIKKQAIEYKGGKCSKCGYSKCNRALVFHHLDPAKKDFQISGSHSFAWEKIKTELDKCVLLCSNCHMELHEALD